MAINITLRTYNIHNKHSNMKKHNKQCTHPFFNEWELPATDWDLSPIYWELCLPEIDLNTWSI